MKSYFVVHLQSKEPSKPTMSIETLTFPLFQSKPDNIEDPDLVYDYSRRLPDRAIIAVNVPDKDGNSINLKCEEHQRQAAQTQMQSEVIAKARSYVSSGGSVNLKWMPVMGNEREQAVVKGGEGGEG